MSFLLDGNGDEAQQDQEDESKLPMLSQYLMVIMTSCIHIRSTIEHKFCPVLEIWETLRSQRLVKNGIPMSLTSSGKLLLFL